MKTDFGWNLGYVDDLYAQYLKDPASVSAVWQEFFTDYTPSSGTKPVSPTPASTTPLSPTQPSPTAAAPTSSGAAATPAAASANTAASEEGADEAEQLRGVGARIVENMETSLGVPTATSVRDLPVKLLEENRQIINNYRVAAARRKVSFTHFIAWAVVRALGVHTSLNHGYEERDGKPFRIARQSVNLGLAVDVEKRGQRQLLVPNIKNAGSLHFGTFLDAYNELIVKARSGKLTLDDFKDTSVSITNPGMIGTVLSVPRLMAGQGSIIGVGSISYPAEYAGLTSEAVAQLGLSRRLTLTSTYDHRVIQGAESGAFLATVERLLLGGDNFYEEVFTSLGIPHEPMQWRSDDAPPILEALQQQQGGETHKQARVLQLIDSYRTRGHLHANIDPLGTTPEPQSELELHSYDLSVWDLDRRFWAQGLAGVKGTMTLRTILETLRQTYCRYVGVEYLHNPSLEERQWLQERMETSRNSEALTKEEQLRILTGLNAAEAFERFLHNTYVGHKRFSLEGAETLIPLLDDLLTQSALDGVQEIVIGMSHRGRLNVLTNIVGKPLNKIFDEFEALDPDSIQGSGDVKYHLGARGVHRTQTGEEVKLTIASNPSHLESVDPVVEGIVRARQTLDGDFERKKIVPLLLHGDAAFAGQGVVTETLNLSMLSGYRTGGTIHIVVNNQIGFTTSPVDARSSQYATDVAKTVGAPILHVNADHPEAAVAMIRLALAYRQKWHRDVVVDLVCYRRWGHNEGDEPTYTQPIMYERIKNRRSTRKIYTERLLRHGDIDVETAERMLNDFQERLDVALQITKDAKEGAIPPTPHPDMERTEGAVRPHVETGTPREQLAQILNSLQQTPDDFEVHPKLARQLAKRQDRFDGDKIDWGLAETLAFGSLVLDGKDIRLSGQDSGRATFSQRHATLYDHRNANRYVPLQHVAEQQGRFSVYDSSLSEFAVLGFEYGYSVENPSALVLWEAQFGDFVNGGQVIIDQYISSAEEKWGQRSNLVLLLPHGYEGQGPEHSSARLERFLQLTSEGNMQVCYPTTPAQYFHLLRRQVSRDEHKPLVVMTPKSLLRLPAATSAVDELTSGHFLETIDDSQVTQPESVKSVLLCSGKVYYDMLAFRKEHSLESVALVRVEQFYPFPDEQLTQIFDRYPNAYDIVWVQEEPRNMGAWDFLDARIWELLEGDQTLRYAGRPWSASPATGSHLRHSAEQDLLLRQAFNGVLATT